MKIIILFLILLVLIGSILLIYQVRENHQQEKKTFVEGVVYQGPVPQGYDEKYFRENGRTIPIR